MNKAFLLLILFTIGLAWGLTVPLNRIAVLGGYKPYGLIAWQTGIGVVVLSATLLLRQQSFPGIRQHLKLFLVVGLLGTLLPNSFSYLAAGHLPGGILAIVIALVPMFAMPIAAMLGLDRFEWQRSIGLALGAGAVALLFGPSAGLPPETALIWIAIALIAPFCYALEGNYLSWRGETGIDPVATLWGASLLAAALSIPLAFGTGQAISPFKPWGPPEWAILGIGLCHSFAYVGYIWMIGRAGSVFASQVAYTVTGTGVLWSMLLLGERYSSTIWIALFLMLAGLSLVQPRVGRSVLRKPSV